MNDPLSTRLTLEAHRVALSGPALDREIPGLGVKTIAALLRHAPPTAVEIEGAIDAIEDALMAARLGHADRGGLETRSAWLGCLSTLAPADATLAVEQVEALFQRLASAAHGSPSALDGLPADAETAAALLILREILHHLGFDRVQVAATP